MEEMREGVYTYSNFIYLKKDGKLPSCCHLSSPETTIEKEEEMIIIPTVIEKNVTLVDNVNVTHMSNVQLMQLMKGAAERVAYFNDFEKLSKSISTESFVSKSISEWQEVFDTLEEELNTRDPKEG